jgi:predicted Zn finger-like uncharacterized protein
MSGMTNLYPGTGTTLCPHCGTRFKIAQEQLEAHHGMVRCGNCHKAFDPRPNYAPEEIDPQLELPILDETEIQPEPFPLEISVSDAPNSTKWTDQQPFLSADKTAFVPETYEVEFLSKPRSPFWTVASFLLLLLLLAQAIFLFRVELAARVPGLKPGLLRYCQILKCTVPLPKNASLLSIESSELKDDPAHRNQIILIAQLRNRASYTQAFPNLELTLTDLQDNALARRIFMPDDYLPQLTGASAGFSANQELGINLRLDTTDLKPVGYRLVLYYPKNSLN